MKRETLWAIAAIGAAACVARGVVSAGRAATSEVMSGIVRETVITPAVVVATNGVAEVRSRSDGRVVRVYVRDGDRVEEGALLAELESSEVRIELDRLRAEERAAAARAVAIAQGARNEEREAADAELQAAKQELELARDSGARTAKLRALGAETEQASVNAKQRIAIAQANVDRATARRNLALAGGRHEDIDAARAQLTAASSMVDHAQRRMSWTRIVSPISGVITSRAIDEGDTITGTSTMPGTALFEVADTSRTELLIEIEDGDAMRVAIGQEVDVMLPGGATSIEKARITRVSPRLQRRSIDANDLRARAETMVRSAWAEWSGGPVDLPIGKRLETTIHFGEREVASRVPRSAVTIRDGKATVEVLHGGLFATTLPVTLGAADPQYVEVNGVTPGTLLRLKPPSAY